MAGYSQETFRVLETTQTVHMDAVFQLPLSHTSTLTHLRLEVAERIVNGL